MKRVPFKRPEPPAPRPCKQINDGYTLRPRSIAVAVAGPARATVSIAKARPARSEDYRRLVASLPCDLCGAVGRSQAAHPNTGKGMASKADDRLCFPLCTGFHGVGCHELFDQHALMTKHARRTYEPKAGARARAAISSAGMWPSGIPPWVDDEVTK